MTGTDTTTAVTARRGLLGAIGAAAAVAAAAGATTGRAHAAPRVPQGEPVGLHVDVRTHGAVGDGQADDVTAIQAAVDEAAGAGGGVVALPAGIYLISEPIRMANGVRLLGVGTRATTIRAANDSGWGQPHRFHGMVDMLGVVDAGVTSLTLDQNGVGRVTSVAICHYTMLISGSSRCDVEDVNFVGHGLEGENAWPSGPALLISSRDDPSSSLGSLPGHPTSDIRVTRCTFVQDDRLHQNFAIRVYTQFASSTVPPPPMPTVWTSDVTIAYCRFEGDVGWQTIEFAGKTQSSRVISCNFRGKALSHIEFDKGASHCLAAFNVIEDSGKPPHLLTNTNTRVAAIWDHGGGEDDVRGNRNNTIAFNTVRNVVTAGAIDPFEAAITVGTWTKNCTVIGNHIDGVNGATIGGGIHLQRSVDGAIIESNNVSGTKYGIWLDWNFSGYNGIQITNNQLYTSGPGIEMRKLPGEGRDFIITGNRVVTSGAGPAIDIRADSLEMPVISQNTTTGGTAGFRVQVPAVLIGNVVRQATETSYDCLDSVTMVANVSLEAAAADLRGDTLPSLSANVFAGADRSKGPKVSYAATPPTAGTWNKGDVVYNTDVKAGAPFAWVCVTDGSPGRWHVVSVIRGR